MTNLKIAVFLLAAITFTSCKKKSSDQPAPDPVANFSISLSPNNHAPATATLTNTSTNATSYTWDYGDGNTYTTSSSATHTHTFTSAGTFNVSLTASNSSGTSNTSTIQLQILNTITYARITSISLTQFPTRDSAGNPWDAADGPDIYFKLYQNDTAAIHTTDFSANVQNNVTSAPVTLSSLNYTVPSFSDTMYVAAFDKDTPGPDTVMGKRVQPLVGFKLSDYTHSYPTSINISSAGDSLKFTIGLQWQ